MRVLVIEDEQALRESLRHDLTAGGHSVDVAADGEEGLYAALEYPILLVCGLHVPVAHQPGWAHPVSWALGPTWGMRTIREAAYGGAPLGPLLLTLALAGVYLAVGVVVLRVVLDSARKRATLSLA